MMLKLDAIEVKYGSTRAVNNVTLSLNKGEIGCLLGPSGCGKTTILRAIAGFQPITMGEIILRSTTVSSSSQFQPPENRNIAVVFQDFALFPHLTVEQNIAFGLHKLDKQQRQRRVNEMLELVELTHIGKRFPHQLSGGQQQRVALARAMAAKPELLLLDEPFANLDADLREDLARQVRKILKHENATALMVTHDQLEAFATADTIAVMEHGRVHQWASAYDLYHRPASRFVADFIGNGVFISGTVQQDRKVATPLGVFSAPIKLDIVAADQLDVLVRPDDVVLDSQSQLKMTVVGQSFRGSHILYDLASVTDPDVRLLCMAASHQKHNEGEQVGITLDLEHLIVFKVISH